MFRSFFVGAALAASALTASAAATVLTFEDLPPPDGFFDATLYHGFDLSNALTGNAGTNYWALGTSDYPSFGTTNASVDGPAGAFSAFAITAPMPALTRTRRGPCGSATGHGLTARTATPGCGAIAVGRSSAPPAGPASER